MRTDSDELFEVFDEADRPLGLADRPRARTASILLAGCALALSASAMGASLPDSYYESFENGVPSYFKAARPDSLSVSPWHYKHGTNSLRWDWQPGEALVIRRGIGDPARTGGFLCRASFVVWVYMEAPATNSLVFSFRAGNTVTGSFRFPLQFTGWRQARLHYDRFPDGRPTEEVDNIRLAASDPATRGTAFLDYIKFNTLTYYSAAVNPERTILRRPIAPDEKRYPRPAVVTDAEREGLRKLGDAGPAARPGIPEAQVSNLCKRVTALGIVRDEHGVRGPGIDTGRYYCSAYGEYGGQDVRGWPDELGPNGIALPGPGAADALAGSLAGAWRASTNDAQRARLEEAFLTVADYLADQGQSLGLETVIAMRDPLARSGRLPFHMDAILYASGANGYFVGDDEPVTSNMDFYAYYVRRLIRLAFMQPDEAERVRWVNAWKAMLERSILQPASALKIDGSAYHHRGHYPSYAQNAFVFLPKLFEELKGTPWPVCAEAQARLRRAVLAQRFYCNRNDKLLALSGRSPFDPNGPFIGIMPGYGDTAFDTFARLGTPDGMPGADREMAAAYLRLAPTAATNEFYRNLDVKPEPDPQGTFVMPYAALLCHRRDNWLAGVKGQSRYCWGSERQDHRNCYGLFQGLGNLEVLAGGNPVNAKASGRVGAGWDWRRFEGTTAPQLPLHDVDLAWGSDCNVTFSPESFVGGLSHQGRQGLFAMVLNETLMPAKHVLRGNKSWFFNDNQIVCLGSDIACDEAGYPTQTTLCQKALATNEQGRIRPTLVDGAPFAAFPEERALDPAKAHWFLDVQQTGYYVPTGQAVTVARQRQKSRDVSDLRDTEGDFLAAWIDHGKEPKGASYEYMLVVRATPEAMKKYAADPPYRVLQRDQAAHIVRHTASGRWGGAFFVPQQVMPTAVGADALPILAVDRPCLVMAEAERNGRLELSAADPDLNLVGGVSQARPLRITLRGNWQLMDAAGTVCAWRLPEVSAAVRIASADAKETVLEIFCQHGASYNLVLAR